MMAELGNLRIMEILAETTNIIAEGEVMQLMNCNDPSTTEESYFQVIYCKTAKLFEAATRLGAVLCGSTPELERAMQDYRRYLGTAFQIIDDVMDYTSPVPKWVKTLVMTWPRAKPTPTAHLCHPAGE